MPLLVETKTNSAYRKNCFINAYLIRRYTGLTGQLAFMKIINIYSRRGTILLICQLAPVQRTRRDPKYRKTILDW